MAPAEGALAALCAVLHRRVPAGRPLLLSDHDDAGSDAAALSAGIDAVVHPAALAAERSRAVDTLLAGSVVAGSDPAGRSGR